MAFYEGKDLSLVAHLVHNGIYVLVLQRFIFAR